MKHVGNLTIRTQADADKYAGLTEVTGYLYIYASAKFDAPQLESVGGYLYINASAKFDALKSGGGDLSIYASAKFDAPQLESVGGDLYIYAKGSLIAGKLYTGGYDKFRVIDNIGCVVLSTKKQGKVTVLMCRHSKIKNQKVIGEKFFVAQEGDHNAHGKTIAEATQELAFKSGNRDVSQWKNLPPTTKKTPQEWAVVYRMITGACQYGTKDFMERKGKLKKAYTLDQIIAETRGAYGHEKFRQVVTGS
jgi:hypothetical protein